MIERTLSEEEKASWEKLLVDMNDIERILIEHGADQYSISVSDLLVRCTLKQLEQDLRACVTDTVDEKEVGALRKESARLYNDREIMDRLLSFEETMKYLNISSEFLSLLVEEKNIPFVMTKEKISFLAPDLWGWARKNRIF